MAGIYLHIPFCKKACHYCNFHFSTSLRGKSAMVEAIVKEIALQKDYLQGQALSSIYFGGGTPSLLDVADLDRIFEAIHKQHRVLPDAEITLEANPDDLNLQKLLDLKQHTPVNRLSIGVQSFSEEDLLWMNRAHNAHESRACIENALKTGFKNLTVDLIYGAPTTSDEQWQENLQIIFDYKIPHLSSYCLTVEDGTALGSFVKKGKQAPMDEAKAVRQFEFLMAETAKNGFEHYEISNFAKPGMYARHNSNYWSGEYYVGIGPSAHSFNGFSRQWNVTNNAKYVKEIDFGAVPFELEILSKRDQYNEYVMTSLRTQWGCAADRLARFGGDYQAHFIENVAGFVDDGTVFCDNAHYKLTQKGKLLADGIAAYLFFPENAE